MSQLFVACRIFSLDVLFLPRLLTDIPIALISFRVILRIMSRASVLSPYLFYPPIMRGILLTILNGCKENQASIYSAKIKKRKGASLDGGICNNTLYHEINLGRNNPIRSLPFTYLEVRKASGRARRYERCLRIILSRVYTFTRESENLRADPRRHFQGYASPDRDGTRHYAIPNARLWRLPILSHRC